MARKVRVYVSDDMLIIMRAFAGDEQATIEHNALGRTNIVGYSVALDQCRSAGFLSCDADYNHAITDKGREELKSRGF